MSRAYKPHGEAHHRFFQPDLELDPFATLDVTRADGEAAIRQAYLNLVRRYPPERDPETFKRVRRAYELLNTPAARAAALVWVPEPPPGDDLTLAPEPDRPALAGIPLGFLLGFDPFSDLVRTDFPEDTGGG